MSGAFAALTDFSNVVARDLWALTTGREVGSGVARRVFAYHPDPSLVLKVEDGAGDFQNVAEWHVWQAVKDTKWAKWFAPVHSISANGALLLMKRTEPAGLSDYPARLPVFMTDIKRSNFGMLDGQLVAHDYGTVPLVMLGTGMSARTRKVEWSTP